MGYLFVSDCSRLCVQDLDTFREDLKIFIVLVQHLGCGCDLNPPAAPHSILINSSVKKNCLEREERRGCVFLCACVLNCVSNMCVYWDLKHACAFVHLCLCVLKQVSEKRCLVFVALSYML